MKIYILISYYMRGYHPETKIEKLFISGKNAKIQCELKNSRSVSRTYEVKMMRLNMDVL